MKLRPINAHVVVKSLDLAEKTVGGIYLPDTAREKLYEGEVIAVADDATDEVAVGDRIIYRQHSGTEAKIEDEDLVLLTADDLLAKYEQVDKIPE